MRKLAIMTILGTSVLLSGCAGYWNKVNRDGGMFGTYNGDWIVIHYNGGHITDVWKLENRLVQSEEHSDGWLFTDDEGNAVNTGGSTKAIRFNRKDADWTKYHEYHMEFTDAPYTSGK